MKWFFNQFLGEPLFGDVLWNKPENRRYAGKLLIVGGQAQSFAGLARAFAAAMKAGIGSARVALPDSTRKALGKGFLEAEFLPSTPSGSFAVSSLAGLLESAEWADGVLLAGDFGRNSETAILLEKFTSEYHGLLVVAGDCIDYFIGSKEVLMQRPSTVSAASFSQLQKLGRNIGIETPLLHGMDLLKAGEVLASWPAAEGVGFLTEHENQIVVSCQGRVSATKAAKKTVQLDELAAYAAVWAIQQSSKPFEALCTAVYDWLMAE